MALVAAITGVLCVQTLPASGAVAPTRSFPVVPFIQPAVPSTKAATGPAMNNSVEAGYSESDLEGPLTVTSSFAVPKLTCTNIKTVGAVVTIATVLAAEGGTPIYGGGVEASCVSLGVASYEALTCAGTCTAAVGAVAPGDILEITIDAGGCSSPICADTSVTVEDATQPWTVPWSGATPSFFNDAAAVVEQGAPPLPDFGKVRITASIDSAGVNGQRLNLATDRLLARTSKLSAQKTRFTVTWVAAD
jgi:hypothetical protein